MRRLFLITVLGLGACNPPPTAPAPLNVEVLQRFYVCQTQPREYIVNGISTWEVDTYEQSTPCPKEKIR